MLRKIFPNDDRFKFGDDILSSFQEVKEVVLRIVNPSTDGFIVDDSLVQEITNYYWQKSGQIVFLGEAELLGMILHQISNIGIMHSDLCKMLKEYDNQIIQLKRLLESEPRRIHLKSDNSSGLSCVITSDLLKYLLLNSLNNGLNHEESPLLNLKSLTYDLGEFVCNFEGSANLLLRQKAGKVASYVFLGDIVYMFKGIAPNPDKWSDCNPKEKYDIVKGWVKQYEKHKSVISD